MDIVFSHTSALFLLRNHRKAIVARPELRTLPKRPPTASIALQWWGAWTGMCADANLDASADKSVSKRAAPSAFPIHVLAARCGKSRIPKLMRCHGAKLPLPRGSLCALDSRTGLASPEFAFLQLAKHLPIVEAAGIAAELCGSYAI